MAASNSPKNVLTDFVKEEGMWKLHVHSEDESVAIWKQNWGFCLDIYSDLQKALAEVTRKSKILMASAEEAEHDKRVLSKIPESTNHMYGWVAKEDEFQLQTYGPDQYQVRPLPPMYKIPRH